MLRQLIGRFLAESGWAVAEAGNADDALQILKRTDEGHAIDLLITDVEMRGRKDGFVLAAGAVTMCPDIKVLYISGHFEDRPAVRQGLREAGRSFIRKPFSRDDFLQAINNALESPRDAADAFAAILGHPSVEARAITDRRPADASERRLRYRVRVPIRYRLAGATDWECGVTRDISRSGVFFDASSPIHMAPLEHTRPAIEVRMELPAAGEDASVEITGRGHVARTAVPDGFAMPTAMAVSVNDYRTDIS